MPELNWFAPDTRHPTAWANYPGNQVDEFNKIGAYGPTTYGTPAYAVSMVYNADTDRTRVGFSFLKPPPELPIELVDGTRITGPTPQGWQA